MSLIKTFLALGIAIIFTIFIAYGVYIFHPYPNNLSNNIFNDCKYCDFVSECRDKLGDVQEYPKCQNSIINSEKYKLCQKEYEECTQLNRERAENIKNKFNMTNFFILLFFSLLAIIIGFFLKNLEGIGSGFLGGGILLIIWSLVYTWEYWFGLNRYLKFGLLGVLLLFLIIVGYMVLEKRK